MRVAGQPGDIKGDIKGDIARIGWLRTAKRLEASLRSGATVWS
jgi:hypothetical protein